MRSLADGATGGTGARTKRVLKSKLTIVGYHRTKSIDAIYGIGTLGVQVNDGLYGVGFYMCRTLEAQMNPGMNTYGKELVKCRVDITRFICFDENMAIKVWGEKRHSLQRQLLAVKKDWTIPELKFIKAQSDDLTAFWNKQSGKTLAKKDDNGDMLYDDVLVKFSSEVAKRICDRLNLHNKGINGIMYTGSKDGKCVVPFKASHVMPLRFVSNVDTRRGSADFKHLNLADHNKYDSLDKQRKAKLHNQRMIARWGKAGLGWKSFKTDDIKNQLMLSCNFTKLHTATTKQMQEMINQNLPLKERMAWLEQKFKTMQSSSRRLATFLEVWCVLCLEHIWMKPFIRFIQKQFLPADLLHLFGITKNGSLLTPQFNRLDAYLFNPNKPHAIRGQLAKSRYPSLKSSSWDKVHRQIKVYSKQFAQIIDRLHMSVGSFEFELVTTTVLKAMDALQTDKRFVEKRQYRGQAIHNVRRKQLIYKIDDMLNTIFFTYTPTSARRILEPIKMRRYKYIGCLHVLERIDKAVVKSKKEIADHFKHKGMDYAPRHSARKQNDILMHYVDEMCNLGAKVMQHPSFELLDYTLQHSIYMWIRLNSTKIKVRARRVPGPTVNSPPRKTFHVVAAKGKRHVAGN